jgi:hypothetical protein
MMKYFHTQKSAYGTPGKGDSNKRSFWYPPMMFLRLVFIRSVKSKGNHID